MCCSYSNHPLALPGTRIGSVQYDALTLLLSSLALMLGYQSVLFGILAKTFAVAKK